MLGRGPGVEGRIHDDPYPRNLEKFRVLRRSIAIIAHNEKEPVVPIANAIPA
jgi:hypothetical protein